MSASHGAGRRWWLLVLWGRGNKMGRSRRDEAVVVDVAAAAALRPRLMRWPLLSSAIACSAALVATVIVSVTAAASTETRFLNVGRAS